MAKAAISVENLTYESENKRIIDDLSIDIIRGSRFGLLGPKNAGKTSLIRLLTGSLKPTSGTMEVYGFDPRSQAAEIRHRMGILLNPPELYNSLSILDNMEFYAWARELGTEERQGLISEMLNHFGLWEKRHYLVEGLTDEQKQLLGMATLFLHRPSLIILDDPTAGLDPLTAFTLREKLAALIETRPLLTVFLVTENPADARRFCEQVAIFHDGRIIKEGAPGELGFSGELPWLRIAGEGFNEIILQLLFAEPQVAQVELKDDSLWIKFSAGLEMVYLTSIIEEVGAKITGMFWEESTDNNILTELIERERGKLFNKFKPEGTK